MCLLLTTLHQNEGVVKNALDLSSQLASLTCMRFTECMTDKRMALWVNKMGVQL